jgi:hypothetical protein
MASARSARVVSLAISRACSAIFLSRGSAATAFGPRFFVAAPGARSPRSRAARHVASCEEYSPSRRSRAPISPGALQASVSFTILRLYSTVKDRRLAFSVTSVSSPRDVIAVAVMMGSSLALLSKFPGSSCLTHVGREGAPPTPAAPPRPPLEPPAPVSPPPPPVPDVTGIVQPPAQTNEQH